MNERTTYHQDELDEVVVDGGAHLEYMGGSHWFLTMTRSDGSQFCVYFDGVITHTEDRDPVTCRNCGHSYGPHPNTTPSGYLLCRDCGWSPEKKTPA